MASVREETGPDAAVRSPVSHRAVLAIAIPIVFSNVTTPLLGLVDTAVIGRLGEAKYLGGVALGALIFSTVYWAFGFLRMGTTGLTAQAKGAGDGNEIRATLGRSLLIAAAIGLLIICLQWPIKWLAFKLLPGEADVESLARGYYAIRIWSAPAALANYAVLGWFIGLGRAGKALTVQIVLNGINAALDVLFVWGLGWGVHGVAAGTLIAEICRCSVRHRVRALIISGGYRARGICRGFSTPHRSSVRLPSTATSSFGRWRCLRRLRGSPPEGARQGDLVLAVNAILLQFVSVSAFFLDGFAFSAEALVGLLDRRGSPRRGRACGQALDIVGRRHRARLDIAARRARALRH